MIDLQLPYVKHHCRLQETKLDKNSFGVVVVQGIISFNDVIEKVQHEVFNLRSAASIQ